MAVPMEKPMGSTIRIAVELVIKLLKISVRKQRMPYTIIGEVQLPRKLLATSARIFPDPPVFKASARPKQKARNRIVSQSMFLRMLFVLVQPVRIHSMAAHMAVIAVESHSVT